MQQLELCRCRNDWILFSLNLVGTLKMGVSVCLGDRKGIQPVQTFSDMLVVEMWLAIFMFRSFIVAAAICIISCCSKLQNYLTFWYWLTLVVLEMWPLKWTSVDVCVCACLRGPHKSEHINTGLFIPRTFCSRKQKVHTRSKRSKEQKLQWLFVSWTFQSLECLFPWTFCSWELLLQKK